MYPWYHIRIIIASRSARRTNASTRVYCVVTRVPRARYAPCAVRVAATTKHPSLSLPFSVCLTRICCFPVKQRPLFSPRFHAPSSTDLTDDCNARGRILHRRTRNTRAQTQCTYTAGTRGLYTNDNEQRIWARHEILHSQIRLSPTEYPSFTDYSPRETCLVIVIFVHICVPACIFIAGFEYFKENFLLYTYTIVRV